MPWQRLLWVRQPHSDNYVDASFLSELRRNTKVHPFEYSAVVADTSTIVLNLCLVSLFWAVFSAIYSRDLEPTSASFTSSLVAASLFLFWALDPRTKSITVAHAAKSLVLIAFCVLGLVPVLVSLTRSTSSDSIWALTLWLNLFTLVVASRPLPTGNVLILATNTSLFATIVLASRLEQQDAVFHFVLFAITSYVFAPSAARWLWTNAKTGYWLLYFAALLCAFFGVFWHLGLWAAYGWLCILGGVQFGIPFLLLRLQRYKNQILGPWDPAVVAVDGYG